MADKQNRLAPFEGGSGPTDRESCRHGRMVDDPGRGPLAIQPRMQGQHDDGGRVASRTRVGAASAGAVAVGAFALGAVALGAAPSRWGVSV